MKECLQCKKEFEPKRPHGKFCSDKCRVQYNRLNPLQAVSKFQMQALYNEIKAAISQIQYQKPPEVYDGAKTHYTQQDEPLQFDQYATFEHRLKTCEDSEKFQKIGSEINQSSLSYMQKQRLQTLARQIFQDKFNF
jgi:hypothetical protein